MFTRARMYPLCDLAPIHFIVDSIAADNFSTTGRKMYHLSSVALAASVPVAIASPSASAVEKGADIIMALGEYEMEGST